MLVIDVYEGQHGDWFGYRARFGKAVKLDRTALVEARQALQDQLVKVDEALQTIGTREVLAKKRKKKS